MSVNPNARIVLTADGKQVSNTIRQVKGELTSLGTVSKTTTDKSATGMAKYKASIAGASQQTKQLQVNTRMLATGMIGLGTGIAAAYTSISNLAKATARLEKAEVAVMRIEDQIATLRQRMNTMTQRGQQGTEKYIVTAQKLKTALTDLAIKEKDVEINAGLVQDTYILFSTSVLNTAVSSLFILQSSLRGVTKAGVANKLMMLTSIPVIKAQSGAMITWGRASIFTATGIKGVSAALWALMRAHPYLLAIGAAFLAWELNTANLRGEVEKLAGTNLGLTDNLMKLTEQSTDADKTSSSFKTTLDGLNQTGEQTSTTFQQAGTSVMSFGTAVGTAKQSIIDYMLAEEDALAAYSESWQAMIKRIKDMEKDLPGSYESGQMGVERQLGFSISELKEVHGILQQQNKEALIMNDLQQKFTGLVGSGMQLEEARLLLIKAEEQALRVNLGTSQDALEVVKEELRLRKQLLDVVIAEQQELKKNDKIATKIDTALIEFREEFAQDVLGVGSLKKAGLGFHTKAEMDMVRDATVSNIVRELEKAEAGNYNISIDKTTGKVTRNVQLKRWNYAALASLNTGLSVKGSSWLQDPSRLPAQATITGFGQGNMDYMTRSQQALAQGVGGGYGAAIQNYAQEFERIHSSGSLAGHGAAQALGRAAWGREQQWNMISSAGGVNFPHYQNMVLEEYRSGFAPIKVKLQEDLQKLHDMTKYRHVGERQMHSWALNARFAAMTQINKIIDASNAKKTELMGRASSYADDLGITTEQAYSNMRGNEWGEQSMKDQISFLQRQEAMSTGVV